MFRLRFAALNMTVVIGLTGVLAAIRKFEGFSPTAARQKTSLGAEEAAERVGTEDNSANEKAAGAKQAAFMAWLKPCPCYKTSIQSNFSATSKAQHSFCSVAACDPEGSSSRALTLLAPPRILSCTARVFLQPQAFLNPRLEEPAAKADLPHIWQRQFSSLKAAAPSR